TELHPSQGLHQNKLLTKLSGFKRFPEPQGWTVTVSHKNPTHSSRGKSIWSFGFWLIPPLTFTFPICPSPSGTLCLVWYLKLEFDWKMLD
ncbi:unnamed protein product, partial [Bubo scandiacus]